MIELFDETIRELVRREVVGTSQVEVSLDAPTKEWASRRNAPTLNLYLYDIRDDLERHEAQWSETRDETGRVTERRPPARRYRLSYLVTAWTQRPEDEHRLLSGCLAAFLRHETLPPQDLTDQPWAVELSIAMPPTQDRSIADVWTALGGELKPSLDLVASVPFVVDRRQPAGPPVLETPRISLVGGAAGEAEGGSRPPTTAGRGRRAAVVAAVPEETMSGGAVGRPGRILHLRGEPRRSS
jgi:hypothetical protein